MIRFLIGFICLAVKIIAIGFIVGFLESKRILSQDMAGIIFFALSAIVFLRLASRGSNRKNTVYRFINNGCYSYLDDVFVKSGLKSKDEFIKIINRLVYENKIVISDWVLAATPDVYENTRKQHVALIEHVFNMGSGILSMDQIIEIFAQSNDLDETQLEIAELLLDDLIDEDDSIEVIDMEEVTLYKKKGMVTNTRYIELDLD